MPLRLKIAECITSPKGTDALYFLATGTFSGTGPAGEVTGDVEALIRQQGDQVEIVNEPAIRPTLIMGKHVAALWGATGLSGQKPLAPGKSLTFKKIWFKPTKQVSK